MTDAFRLFKYWRTHPPLYDIVSALAGVTPADVGAPELTAPLLPEYEE